MSKGILAPDMGITVKKIKQCADVYFEIRTQVKDKKPAIVSDAL